MPELLGGRYRRGRRLGAGHFGHVWIYRDEALAREVAVKFFVVGDGPVPPIDEARRVARINHPNVVAVHDVLRGPDGQIVMIMEYVSGVCVRELRDPIPDPQLAVWADQIVNGLGAIHKADLVHCDLHDGNVLIRRDSGAGWAMILDLGISVGLKSTGPPFGRPEFWAPERFGGHAVAETDLYSLGIVLWQLRTGREIAEEAVARVGLTDWRRRQSYACEVVRPDAASWGTPFGVLVNELTDPDVNARPNRERIRDLVMQVLEGAPPPPLPDPQPRRPPPVEPNADAARPGPAPGSLQAAADAFGVGDLLKAGSLTPRHPVPLALAIVSDVARFRSASRDIARRLDGARLVVCAAAATVGEQVAAYLAAANPDQTYPPLRGAIDDAVMWVAPRTSAIADPAALVFDLLPLAHALGARTVSLQRART